MDAYDPRYLAGVLFSTRTTSSRPTRSGRTCGPTATAPSGDTTRA